MVRSASIASGTLRLSWSWKAVELLIMRHGLAWSGKHNPVFQFPISDALASLVLGFLGNSLSMKIKIFPVFLLISAVNTKWSWQKKLPYSLTLFFVTSPLHVHKHYVAITRQVVGKVALDDKFWKVLNSTRGKRTRLLCYQSLVSLFVGKRMSISSMSEIPYKN